ncbi:MAG: hypothetical protein JNM93_11860 [Bacteriovoracaceae bacterium]|nr:hypothetical protein [Bacteriovoracaceae bacterium]
MAVPVFLSQLIPQDYRPLLAAISPAAFTVVDWKQLLKEMPVLLKRINDRENVSLRSEYASSNDLGQAVLEFYFFQIFNPDGLFLDLRLKNFIKDKNNHVSYVPNGFWIQWQETFRLGLISIYQGFYKKDDEKLEWGLLQVGLIDRKMPKEKCDEVKKMLLAHLGGDYENQTFYVADFTKSFERFFQFLQKNKIRLSVDFLYLGIYLASLYHSLEKVGGTYDVKKCFIEIEEKRL